MKTKYTEIEKQRRNKLEIYNKKNIDPYSRDIYFKDNSKSLEKKYGNLSKEELKEKKIESSIPFRIMTKRGPFIVGKDAFGVVQIYIDKNSDKSLIELKDLFDIGDIINASGLVMKTNTGQLSLKAKKIKLITKNLKPLPEKFHGLKDKEEKYRRRYLDLMMNDETKKTFWTRTKIISYIRSFFDQNNYMEVDTPILTPILGGAAAKPFITKHNALNRNFYLRIATELALKRLLVGGIEKVYEIGRIFRNEGIDTSHNPEFTTIEFYESYGNLETMMKTTEELFNFLSKKLNVENIEYSGQIISLKTPFQRIDLVKEVSKAINIDVTKISFDEAQKIANKYEIKILPYFKVGHIINELFEKLIETKIKNPTFVFNYPIEISPLAAKNKNDPRFTERAELFINGREYANMFTELNDPIDQLERFKQQIIEGEKGNEEANEIDMDYIEALEYGMPPAGGCGIGIDRLVMLFTKNTSIRDVLLFPQLRNKKDKDE